MAKTNYLHLNVSNLFESHSINEIIDIEKSVDAEIERKRIELRSIVGDRYKDILTATEAIKSIESTSESIVKEIHNVLQKCDALVENTCKVVLTKLPIIEKALHEEHIILVQLGLIIQINEYIWVSMDDGNFCQAAQFYLLSQHVHTGLRLIKADINKQYHLIPKLKIVLDMLRHKILLGSLNKLKNVELNIEDTSSLLNTIMLLENHTTTELLTKFINIRKEALEYVINESYSSVRVQIAAMVMCIYTTIQLLHDCFFNYKGMNEGLIWKKIDQIVSKDAPPTFCKMDLPFSNLISHIPQIITDFQPKCANINSSFVKNEAFNLVEKFLVDTRSSVSKGLLKHLEMISSINGIHLIREESLKVEIPSGWEEICEEINLPSNFNVWYYFFQEVMTNHVKYLMTSKIEEFACQLNSQISNILDNSMNDKTESDLQWYIWDDNNANDDCKVLSMKTRGFSPEIVKLCEHIDVAYLNLLKDMSLYLFGKEYQQVNGCFERISSRTVGKCKKFVDREILEAHLKQECIHCINNLNVHLETEVNNSANLVAKSIISARFLTALINLCPSFTKCCSSNQSSDDWEKTSSEVNKSVLKFWDNWISDCNKRVEKKLAESFDMFDPSRMLSILCKWDTIEIQEQTDECVFKSNIKIPMKSSRYLVTILNFLMEMLNALLPHTLPKQVHLKFMEKNIYCILNQYEVLLKNELNQMQALQFLFDVKFLIILTVPRENMELVQRSQDVCDKFRSLVDPFDLDVFYKYLQHNIRQNALQTQMIYGCLLPSSNQLASLGVLEKNKEHEKDPQILALSSPLSNNWFMLLPVTAPITKASLPAIETKASTKEKPRKLQENSVRSGAAALFGAMTNDWFS